MLCVLGRSAAASDFPLPASSQEFRPDACPETERRVLTGADVVRAWQRPFPHGLEKSTFLSFLGLTGRTDFETGALVSRCEPLGSLASSIFRMSALHARSGLDQLHGYECQVLTPVPPSSSHRFQRQLVEARSTSQHTL